MRRGFEINHAWLLGLRSRSGGDRKKQEQRQESGTHRALYACRAIQIAPEHQYFGLRLQIEASSKETTKATKRSADALVRFPLHDRLSSVV
jgi:hypothetical protein